MKIFMEFKRANLRLGISWSECEASQLCRFNSHDNHSFFLFSQLLFCAQAEFIYIAVEVTVIQIGVLIRLMMSHVPMHTKGSYSSTGKKIGEEFLGVGDVFSQKLSSS